MSAIARTFAQLFRKDLSVGDVHVSSTTGETPKKKPKAKLFSTIGSAQAPPRPVMPANRKLPVTGMTAAAMAEAQAGEGTPSQAVDKAAQPRSLQPMGNGSAMAHTPFPHDAGALANLRQDQVPRLFGALTAQDHLDDKTVRLADLTSVQDRVDPAKIEAMRGADAGAAGADGKKPVVVRMGGRDYILDGHHRLAAQWLDGAKEADVKFLDLGPRSDAVKAAGNDNWTVPFAVMKMDPDQCLIFGWASVIERDGIAIIDKQGDIIPAEELEKAAYDFVLYSREHDDLHNGGPTGRCVESMVFTIDKQQALGVDLGKVGWWVGFKVDDPALWEAHKRGERPEFSIGGSAYRQQVGVT